MNRLVIGIMAHVDAGKTTLSEGLLYKSGMLKQVGRVDAGNAFLDTDSMEKARGITIFSKQAKMVIPDKNGDDTEITLLDTPGHVDFSAEMERTLNVLDQAILVISGVDGVQAHTKTLWKLLRHYNVPTIIFINKMDMLTADFDKAFESITSELSTGAVSFNGFENSFESMVEDIASTDEALMEEFLETGDIEIEHISKAIMDRKLFPVISGSALRLDGLEKLLTILSTFAPENSDDKEFGAYCYKITRDEKDVRLSHFKIVGGQLKVKELIGEEKINELRSYSGVKYTSVQVATAGMIVAVPGLAETRPGMAFGKVDSAKPVLEPVLSYAVRFSKNVDRTQMLAILKQLEEELPELSVDVDEEHREIRVSLMGVVQTEIITQLIKDRYDIDVTFDVGSISYKETISNMVEGVGHFEPLRHYAEVHLRMEPLENGSGLVFDSDVSEDLLDKNWQRLIRTHLEERVHRGVLTGSPITDMKITIVGGKAHNKHTEGGDFRQATYRAIRQGLMQAESVLLEPFYDYTLELPESYVGRAMTDIDRMNGTAILTESYDGMAVLVGKAPVATMHTYANDVAMYTKGQGTLNLQIGGYSPCHNTEEVLEKKHYDPDSDMRNPSSSVFCMHGSGTVIPWDQVFDYMHVPSCVYGMQKEEFDDRPVVRRRESVELTIGTDEIDEIIGKISYSNKKEGYSAHKGISAERARQNRLNSKPEAKEVEYKGSVQRDKYVLIDGYNLIFAWDELNELAKDNINSARDKLMDVLCNYQGWIGEEVIVVFDAYKVPNHGTDAFDYYNIHVVYTKTAQTADCYIERFAHEHNKKYDITVVSSDGMVQLITRGQGCRIISSREFVMILNNLKMK